MVTKLVNMKLPDTNAPAYLWQKGFLALTLLWQYYKTFLFIYQKYFGKIS